VPSGRITEGFTQNHYLVVAVEDYKDEFDRYCEARLDYARARRWINAPATDEDDLRVAQNNLRGCDKRLTLQVQSLHDAWAKLRAAMSKAINNKVL